ncbi:MucR family transcriptional regulator [Sphingomonas sp. RIT328]|uniref:MucR family transcriptional regulator n=1 Tax=Sphingomonas sp. RIT328 TaxID=1470591 RepID=UPI00044E4893|nr:MucR family transcriptional regulator [Sphingomonas sp. RIT328]EZP50001.1 ROS/MUCR transcriptional regulator family protein [Sphingomonas sp. RIT328]
MTDHDQVEPGVSTVELATELTVAWLSNSNNRVSADDVPAFLAKMHETVNGLTAGGATGGEAEPAQEYTPATTVRKSLASRDHIISMIDGKPYKTLRRHLATNGMTPDEYRSRYGLKADYPIVAPAYSESRSAMAKTIGLGRKPKQTNAARGDGKAKATKGSSAKAAAKAHLGGNED